MNQGKVFILMVLISPPIPTLRIYLGNTDLWECDLKLIITLILIKPDSIGADTCKVNKVKN